MKAIIDERRELSKAYFELKNQLNLLEEDKSVISSSKNDVNYSLNERSTKHHRERKKQNAFQISNIVREKNHPFERIAGYVVEILRKEGIPLSNKIIHERLLANYEVCIGYANLTNNILRKMIEFDNYSIEKISRGFYQYRKRGIDKHEE